MLNSLQERYKTNMARSSNYNPQGRKKDYNGKEVAARFVVVVGISFALVAATVNTNQYKQVAKEVNKVKKMDPADLLHNATVEKIQEYIRGT